MARVLVVDDEKLIVKGIRFSLEQDGYEVDCAYDGEEAIEMAKKTEYDIVLLDVMLPKHDGFEVCQAIREFSDMPVIMLTAKGSDMDKILGLEYGADDYISKPFNILEVKARIKAIIRRSSKNRRLKKEEANNSVIGQGDLKMDTESRRVFIGEREINLTAKEFDLLELLITNPNKVFNRENLLNLVWGYDYPGDVRTVDVHVRRLREKIEASRASLNIYIQNGALVIISRRNKEKQKEKKVSEDYISYSRKNKRTFFEDAIAEYSKRLGRYCKLEIIQVADEKTPDGASENVERQIREKEGQRILARSKTVLMCWHWQ
mgnify:CR=1 FL=1